MNNRIRKSVRETRWSGGFTFIEVMVVVVIIGMLAGAVTLKVKNYMDTAKVNRAKSDMATIVSAIEAFYISNSRYPTNEEGLDSLDIKVRKDPWGKKYEYNSPGDEDEPFEVISFGGDQMPGGDGIDADIYSWQIDEEDSDG